MRKTKMIFAIVFLLVAALTIYGCGSSGGGGGGGNKTLSMNGGNGTTGYGGNGDNLYIDNYRDVEISTSGSVDANFSIPGGNPSYIDCTLLEEGAANPMEQFKAPAGITNIMAYADTDALAAAGDYYMLFGNSDLKVDSNGNGIANLTDETVECVDIPNGATVTLSLNYDYNGDVDAIESTGSDMAYIYLDGDLRVAGTLTVATLDTSTIPDTNAGAGLDSGMLRVYSHQLYVTSSGSVLAMGGDNAAGRGGHGGDIDLEGYVNDGGFLENLGTIDCSGGDGTTDGGHACADGTGTGTFWASSLYLWSDGRLITRASLIGDGGDGAGGNGGDGAYIDVEADTHVYSTGDISANGGVGGGGWGGDADSVYFYSYTGSVNTDGDISANGGNGTTGGGDGADVEWCNNYASPIRNKATVTVAGGNATVDGGGGDGGYLYLDVYTGPILFAGSFDGSGGDAAGAGNWGGDGDYAYFYVDYDYDYYYGEAIDPGDIEISMDIDLSGGDGAYGGDAGYFDIYNYNNDYDVYPPGGRTLLKGYASMDMSGGDSTGDYGGDGGDFTAYTYSTTALDAYFPAGSIKSNVPMDMSGGTGSMTGGMWGGDGGYFYMEADGNAYVRDSDTTVASNRGALDLSGGNGDNGGYSGGFYIYGYNKAENTAALDVSGGNGTSNGGYGLYDYVEMYATEDVISSGKITGNAGDATNGDGYDAYDVYLAAGQQTRSTGAIEANGGNGTTSGGYGGWIEIFSQATPSIVSGAISVVGGLDTVDGSANGTDGTITVDWMDLTPVDGTL